MTSGQVKKLHQTAKPGLNICTPLIYFFAYLSIVYVYICLLTYMGMRVFFCLFVFNPIQIVK